MPKKRKSTKDDKTGDISASEQQLFYMKLAPPQAPPLRAVSLFGNLDDEQMHDVCSGLLYLKHTCNEPLGVVELEEPLPPKPINFYISTWGGDALSMFAIYDLMRMLREECPIHTFGIGKVMSAGVLLLAGGTKGKRRIAKNCRVMIHSVAAGNAGALHDLTNELEAIQDLQDMYTCCLAAETNMTEGDIKEMLNRNVNVYLSATEAVQLGIADIIVQELRNVRLH